MLFKGLVKILTVVLILFSLYKLSFTYFVNNVEKKIKATAEQNVKAAHADEKSYVIRELTDNEYIRLADSMRGEQVLSLLGVDFTYQELKENELKLGLDLQGGMSVTLEVGIDELIKSMSNSSTNPILLKAIETADAQKANTEADFITLFGQAFESQNPNARLAQYFTKSGQTKIAPTSSNEEVLKVIREEAHEAFNRTYNVITKRVNSTGLEQANINKNEQKGIITVELAGIQDPVSLREKLQAAARLQFWEVRTNLELASSLNNAQEASITMLKNKGADVTVATDTTVKSTDTTKAVAAAADTNKAAKVEGDLSAMLSKDSSTSNTLDSANSESLFTYMSPIVDGNQYVDASVIGILEKKNADKVMEILNHPAVKSKFPANTKFLFGENPYDQQGLSKNDPKALLGVYAVITSPNTDRAPMEGEAVKSAKFDFRPGTGEPEISLSMTSEGARDWANLTDKNKGKYIAIALDNFIYSAPRVNDKITGGQSSITGNFNSQSGTELAEILEVGKLEAPAKIVQEQIIGSTLGAESIKGGLTSFVLSFIIIFAMMIIYYNTGGIVANIALIINLIITFGLLASFGATLTMPGIAGLVLGIGMAVDVNVIIFERIKEELALGKSYEQAVHDGYTRSYAPVFDSHITGLITAAILLFFGFGAIKGFATTQLIALSLSLFTGIFVSRVITDIYMKNGRHFNYFTTFSKRLFQKANFDFLGKRKIAYVISTIIIVLGLSSFFVGFDYGVEFAGGRSYNVRLDKEYNTNDIREALKSSFGEKAPVVKTIGSGNQFNITTDYLIGQTGANTDSTVTQALLDGLKKASIVPAEVSFSEFNSPSYIQKRDKILPSISEDLKRGAIYATSLAIIAIFLYILIRFRKWQYSVATIVSLVHDAAVILALYAFLRHIVPFSLEIDQHFIAAMLTVIGFSMNDTVIVFDRIREYFRKRTGTDKGVIINDAINSTLSRTVMTSLTVFLTVLVLFIFGGEVLRGFAFAMLIGVLTGTYSSIFVAAPMLVDMDKKDTLKVEEDKEERIKALKQQA